MIQQHIDILGCTLCHKSLRFDDGRMCGDKGGELHFICEHCFRNVLIPSVGPQWKEKIVCEQAGGA